MDAPDDQEVDEEVLDLAQARVRALAAFPPTERVVTSQALPMLYGRGRAVRDYVPLRAKGLLVMRETSTV